jgi:N-acyl-L-homoserine lactone synthetase
MILTINKVEDENERKAIYRLRYQVYVQEWGFERPENHREGMEKDEFDESSVHFAVKDEEGNIVGTVRLILNSPKGFPIEKYCHINIDKKRYGQAKFAEISRLAISKKYRRRAEDSFIYGPEKDTSKERIETITIPYKPKPDVRYVYTPQGEKIKERRRRPELVIGLYKAIYHESKKKQITHWYAVMTKGLHFLLRRLGINFVPIGEPRNYHGIRTPYLGDIEKIEKEVLKNNPELYKEFTREL